MEAIHNFYDANIWGQSKTGWLSQGKIFFFFFLIWFHFVLDQKV